MNEHPSCNTASPSNDARPTNYDDLRKLKGPSTAVESIKINESEDGEGKGIEQSSSSDGETVERLQQIRNVHTVVVVGAICLASFAILFFLLDSQNSTMAVPGSPQTPSEKDTAQSVRMKALQMQLKQYYDAGTNGDGVADALYTKGTPQYAAVEWMVRKDSFSELLLDTITLHDNATTIEDIHIPRKILEAFYERYAIVTMYMATGGDINCGDHEDSIQPKARGWKRKTKRAWSNQYGFLSEESVCQWHDEEKQQGVFCNEKTGSVRSLILGMLLHFVFYIFDNHLLLNTATGICTT